MSLEYQMGLERARGLLKLLQQEAESTYDYITRQEILTMLPGPSPWHYHHESLLEEVWHDMWQHLNDRMKPAKEEGSWKNERPQYGPVVLRAAWQHDSQPGRWHYQLQKDTEDREEPLSSIIGYVKGTRGHDSDSTGWERFGAPPSTRRLSATGSDYQAMKRAGWPTNRWKDRLDPRESLQWADLALDF